MYYLWVHGAVAAPPTQPYAVVLRACHPTVLHTAMSSVLPVRDRSTACLLHELPRGLCCQCLCLCLSVQRAAAFRGKCLEAFRGVSVDSLLLVVRMRMPLPSHTLHAQTRTRWASPTKPRAAIGYIYAMRYIHTQALHAVPCVPTTYPCFVLAHHDQAKQASGHAPGHP
jgi:hypothetical protein